MKKSFTLSLILVALVAGLSYFAYESIVFHRASSGSDRARLVEATAVLTSKVTQQDMQNSTEALGSLEAEQRVVISSEDSGRITAINFKNGQQVVKGMPIAQMDNDKAKADYESAVTAMKVLQQKYQRSKLLLNEAVSQQELSQLAADVEKAKSAVQKAQSVLNDKQILAPFTGVLGSFSVQVGAYVATGTPIVTIVNTKKLRVAFSVPEVFLPQLKNGQLVKVTAAAYPKKVFYGTVNYVSPTVEPTTRSIAIQAMIANDKNLLSPGMFVHVTQALSVVKNALVLPQEAVMADIKGYYVYRVINDRAVQTYVTIGARKQDVVQILSGVKFGDVVVSAGQQKLSDGSSVRVIKEGPHPQ